MQTFVAEIPVANLLMGGENGLTCAAFAQQTNSPLRPSTPVTRSPQVELLKEYVSWREEIFAPERFLKTAYWENAKACIHLQGQYFGESTVDGVINRAKRFVNRFGGQFTTDVLFGESPAGSIPTVRRIALSDCFEVTDGKHRLAMEMMRGAQKCQVAILPDKPVLTPMQHMVLGSSWTEGEHVVYQPVNLPECRTWPIVRRCDDRLGMMESFLARQGRRPGSYLDVGSSYGWFVKQMALRGHEAYGVDRDATAIAVGALLYGVDPARIVIDDITTFLAREGLRFDVVSCYSVLHHFVLGRGGTMSPADFIRLVDSVTGSVLFFDTGEAHEDWFKVSLKEWTPDFIVTWLRENTSFTHIELLGVDRDNVGKYQAQYGRHLFACYR